MQISLSISRLLSFAMWFGVVEVAGTMIKSNIALRLCVKKEANALSQRVSVVQLAGETPNTLSRQLIVRNIQPEQTLVVPHEQALN